MATTTNFGWTTPDDTDLVKNGALAIRTLGSAIDTSLGGAWTSYTPTWTNLTIGNGTNDFKYKQINKTVFVRFVFTRGSTTTMSSAPTFTLPVTASSGNSASAFLGTGTLQDTGTETYVGMLRIGTTTTANIRVLNAGGTYGVSSAIDNTTPFTWTTNDQICGDFVYEAA